MVAKIGEDRSILHSRLVKLILPPAWWVSS
jgi:hypothetical protein